MEGAEVTRQRSCDVDGPLQFSCVFAARGCPLLQAEPTLAFFILAVRLQRLSLFCLVHIYIYAILTMPPKTKVKDKKAKLLLLLL